MACTYAFSGHDTIGDYVRRCMATLGYEPVQDAGRADVVFTYFLAASMLEDAYFDDGGLVKCAKPQAMLVDLSPSTPALTREIAAVAAVNDLHFVEMPLSVVDCSDPDAFASPENVACYVACEDEDAARAREIACALADEVHVSKGAGSAQLAKAMRTIRYAAQICAAVESDALARLTRNASMSPGALSMEGEDLPDVIALTAAAVRDEAFEGSYTAEMLMAEVVAAIAAADDVDLIVPQLEAVMHLLELLAVIGGADKAPAALSLLYRDERTSAEHGLDWTRAEGMFAGQDHLHAHAEDDGLGDFYGYDDEAGFGAGYGGFSAN